MTLRRMLPVALLAALAACGIDAPDTPPSLTARPGAAPGCASGSGYALGGNAYACTTTTGRAGRGRDGP